MKIGELEVIIYAASKRATILKKYNEHIDSEISLTEDDIYSLEFAVKEIKRKLGL